MDIQGVTDDTALNFNGSKTLELSVASVTLLITSLYNYIYTVKVKKRHEFFYL